MDDPDPFRVEPEQLDRAVAHEGADHDHAVGAAHRAVPRNGAERALGAREEVRQVEVLEVEQRDDRRFTHGRNAKRERVVHHVGRSEARAQRPWPQRGERHRRESLPDRVRVAVLGCHVERQAAGAFGSDRWQEDAIAQLAVPREPVQKPAHVRLAAAELARYQGQERDPDHVADPSRSGCVLDSSGELLGSLAPASARAAPARADRLRRVRPGVSRGDQDLSRLCLTQALVHGHLSNDVCLTPSFDKALFGGHLYSDKAPGLSVIAIPAVEALQLRPVDQIHGSDLRLWGVRLLTSGVAFLLGAFLVGRIGEGLAPGRGAAALVAFALGTIFAPLAATSVGHIVAATLALAAFALAWRQPLLAGLAAGGALLAEYQTAAILVILGGYVALRGMRALGRYAVGVLPGIALLLIYDALAFGSPFHLSYRYVAIKQQASGFFGIGLPHLHSTYEVFFGSSGLLLISPVLVAAVYGLVLLARTHRAEAIVCGAVAVFFLLLNCGYYLPYGGTLLGPRFFVPALPFLALGLGPAFARRPRLTGALTVLSVVPVVGLTIVWSQNPPLHQTIWGELARLPAEGRQSRLMRHMTDTVFKWISAGSGWGFAVIVVAAAAALVLALPTRPWEVRRDARRHPWRFGAIVVAAIGLLTAAQYVAAKPTVLSTSISGTTSAAFPGEEVDFAVTVVNESGKYLPHAVLMIRLPPGMQLLGRPTFERGHGCTGTSTLVCGLSFLEAHMTTTVHLGIRIEPGAASNLKLTAWGVAGDAVGPRASFTVAIGST